MIRVTRLNYDGVDGYNALYKEHNIRNAMSNRDGVRIELGSVDGAKSPFTIDELLMWKTELEKYSLSQLYRLYNFP